jgi:ribosome maturation factor RimP
VGGCPRFCLPVVEEREEVPKVDVVARVQHLVEPLVAADGLELVDVQLAGGSLQVFVDRAGGLDLDAISLLSSRISAVLDEHDPVPGRYVLEVSSPGLERPLHRPDHFRRFVGTTVSVKTRPGVEGERRQKGRLEEADDDGVVVAGRRLSYADIETARTVFEWGAPPKARRGQKVKATAPGGDGAPASARRAGDADDGVVVGPRPGRTA